MKATNEESVQSADGTNIHFRVWRPEVIPRASIVIVPGFNAYSAYYEWVAGQLVAERFAVYALDLRGRGNSDGERFYVESFDDYVSDVESVITIFRTREEDRPVFMLGHSAGGVVACLYALEHEGELSGLISESFAHELPALDLVLSVFKGLSYLAPHIGILHLPNDSFSRDPQVVEMMDRDPLIKQEKQPTQTMAAMIRADERLKKEFSLITLPILILHGTADKNIRPSGSQHLYEMVGSTDKNLNLYDGGYHDLLNDLDKEQVLGDIVAWIDGHLPVDV